MASERVGGTFVRQGACTGSTDERLNIVKHNIKIFSFSHDEGWSVWDSNSIVVRLQRQFSRIDVCIYCQS